MKITHLKWGAICLAALFVGCSDDKTDIDNPEGPQGSGTMQVMSPEESLEYLEAVGAGLMEMLNPEEQRPIIELAAYYAANYASYSLPSEFLPEGVDFSPAEYLRQLAEAVKGYFESFSGSVNFPSLTLSDFSRLAGVYEPDIASHSWVRTADAEAVIFRFPDKEGKEAELAYTPMSEAPMNFTISLTDGGARLANTTVSTTLDEKKQRLSADIESSLMNLQTVTKVSGINSKVEQKSQLFVSNIPAATFYATIEGDGLCDPSRWKALKDIEKDLLDDQIGKMIKKGYCGIDIAGKVQVYGQMDYYSRLPIDIAGAYGVWDSTDHQIGEEACQEACNRLNMNLRAQLRYNNTATNQATSFFRPKKKNAGTMTEYYPEAVLRFPDGSLYTPSEYFSTFTSTAAGFQSLIQGYIAIWKQAIADAQ